MDRLGRIKILLLLKKKKKKMLGLFFLSLNFKTLIFGDHCWQLICVDWTFRHSLQEKYLCETSLAY